MAGIRVNTGVKKIEVNDNGDYIELNLGDHSFLDRFFALLDKIQALAKEAEPQEKAIREQHEEGSLEMVRALVDLDTRIHKEIAAEVDGLFGSDTCKKVFGNIVPGVELFADFFEQLTPYVQEYGAERAKRMSKYSAARTGNV